MTQLDWRQISGWFDTLDAEVFRIFARDLPDGAHVVEIGSWLGRSTCALVTAFRAARKDLVLAVVDTFKGTLAEPCRSHHAPIVESLGGSLRPAFEANLRAFNCSPRILEMESLSAVVHFDPASLDAVFIDASHAEEDVRADIAAWLPKLKPGGMLAGHDINLASVRAAVTSAFGYCYVRHGDSWLATPGDEHDQTIYG